VCVCLSGFLSAMISPESHERFLPNFYACCLWPWLGPLRQGNEIQGDGAILVVFIPTDNALYSTAFGTI